VGVDTPDGGDATTPPETGGETTPVGNDSGDKNLAFNEDSLPVTGTDTMTIAGVGAAVAAGGVGIVLLTRRRRAENIKTIV
jgi:LPXTG-motif cell wall-anchored protein